MNDKMIFYRSTYDAAKHLPPKDRLRLYESLFELGFYLSNKPDISGYAGALYEIAATQVRTNLNRQKNGEKGKNYGKMGGRPVSIPQQSVEQAANLTQNLTSPISLDSKITPRKPQNNPKITPRKPQNNPKSIIQNAIKVKSLYLNREIYKLQKNGCDFLYIYKNISYNNLLIINNNNIYSQNSVYCRVGGVGEEKYFLQPSGPIGEQQSPVEDKNKPSSQIVPAENFTADNLPELNLPPYIDSEFDKNNSIPQKDAKEASGRIISPSVASNIVPTKNNASKSLKSNQKKKADQLHRAYAEKYAAKDYRKIITENNYFQNADLREMFIEHCERRAAVKDFMTERAIKMGVDQLARLSNKNVHVAKIIMKHVILHNWKGVKVYDEVQKEIDEYLAFRQSMPKQTIQQIQPRTENQTTNQPNEQ